MAEPEGRDTVTERGSITPERFARVRAIFEAALEAPVAERNAYVEGACRGDHELLGEVQAMLAAERQSDLLLDRPPSTPQSTAPEEGRFPAGTLLAGRYRILGLLGRGGMGEVYRAHDLILNQNVALKFLSPACVSEPALVRFRNEVRIARQVSHPNVCRVYDLGVVEGLHFLSMEYVDGEDLASLLRRIGRLPQDKATEFTRKICAGLGAAHERGVLHRDLKPANIMIDGRGQVRITDFGLAGIAEEIPRSDLRSGTPAYLSPEQKAGKEVTTRSDIYALGLVLHEMFTGKQRSATQSDPTELVKELDPAIERLILRCLEDEPKRRPASALSIAMALPGGDPMAMALAAGETPSPEVVAASQERQGLSARAAVICFLSLVPLIAIGFIRMPGQPVMAQLLHLNVRPEVSAFQARQMLQQFGYREPPRAAAYGYGCCLALGLLNRLDPARRDEVIRTNRPAVLQFWYRQNQRSPFWADAAFGAPLAPGMDNGIVSFVSPANTEPGMTRMILDMQGRLVLLEARPETRQQSATVDASPVDWSILFRAAGLDPARFTPVTRVWAPPMAFDARGAWKGNDGFPEEVQVQAAAWQGRPVFFRVLGSWARSPLAPAGATPAWILDVFLALPLAIGGAVVVARRNLRSGRGDRRGANVVACVYFISAMAAWSLRAEHVPYFWEIHLVFSALAEYGLIAGLIWLAYLAIEPYARRHWPDALISWNRLRSLSPGDPLVASHVLVGFVAGTAIPLAAFWVKAFAGRFAAPRVDTPPPEWLGPEWLAARLLATPAQALLWTTALLLIVVLSRLVLRHVWLADIVASALAGSTMIPLLNDQPFWVVVIRGFAFLAGLWVFRRFGLLAAMAAFFAALTLWWTPPSLTAWYSGSALLARSILIVIAAWALWVVASDKHGTAQAGETFAG